MSARPVLQASAELNGLFEKAIYTDPDLARMRELIVELGLDKSDTGPFVLLRQIRGRMVSRPRNGPFVLKAKGREDWVGWVELRMAPVNEIAIMNTGRVIRDVNADILAVIEAEDRVALKQFSDFVIREVGGLPYDQVMVIDGNDDRGIDVGLMTKAGYTIGAMRSHIHDLKPDGAPIYSRDCPEYMVHTPSGETIWVVPNHFKSKFGGDDPDSCAKREAQAIRTAEIYRSLRAEGHDKVVVLGDLTTPRTASRSRLCSPAPISRTCPIIRASIPVSSRAVPALASEASAPSASATTTRRSTTCCSRPPCSRACAKAACSGWAPGRARGRRAGPSTRSSSARSTSRATTT
jgi:hypothetical protein